MIALDTETTGLLKPSANDVNLQPKIIEIYACKFDQNFEITDEFETFIYPNMPVSEEITKITGIENEDLKGAPLFIEIYPKLCDFFCGEKTMFAHNCSFDGSMILYELMRHGYEYKFPWPRHWKCTVELSYALQNKRLTLGKLYEIATGKELQNAHRAKNDVLAMVQCIKWLCENEFLSLEGLV